MTDKNGELQLIHAVHRAISQVYLLLNNQVSIGVSSQVAVNSNILTEIKLITTRRTAYL